MTDKSQTQTRGLQRSRKPSVSRPKSHTDHPKYIDMIKDALVNLKQPKGSPKESILKYICANYKIKNETSAKRFMNLALWTGVKNGSLEKLGRSEANEKYILADTTKPATKPSKPKTATYERALFRSTDATSGIKKQKSLSRGPERISKPKLDEKLMIGQDLKRSKSKVVQKTSKRIEKEDSLRFPESGPSEAFAEYNILPVYKPPSLQNIRVRHQDRFFVKTLEDRNTCYITAMDITPDGRILLADHGNMNVKLFGKDGLYHASLSLQNSPLDIAAMNNDEAMVAFEKENLLSLNVTGSSMRIEQEIKLNFNVNYISSYHNRIVAICWDETKSVKLLDKHGKVYWSRSLTDKGHPLFDMPFYTTAYMDNSKFRVVVYDYRKRKLIILDGEDGSIVKVFKLASKGKAGVVCGSGGIPYVCYYEMSPSIVYVWDSFYRCRKKFLSALNGLGPYPQFIKYSNSNHQLLVSYSVLSESNNHIDCFSVK